MKILILTNDYFDALYSRAELSDWFYKNRKVQVDIIYPKNEEISLIKGKIFFFDKRGVSIRNIKQLNRILIDNDYTVIIARGIENIVLITLCKTDSSKVVFLLTGLGRLFSNNLYFKFIIRKAYKFCFKCLIKISSAEVILQNETDKRDLSIKECFIMDGSGLKRKPINKKKTSDYINILTASRLTKSKGIEEILKFCQAIKGKKNIRYYILGEYHSLPKKYLNKIEIYNKCENIFFKGFTLKTEKYFNSSHFAFLPTNYREGSPRFLIESLKFGLVIFSSKMPGCSKIISNNNGYHYRSIEEMLCIIKYLQNNNDMYLQKSENSQNFFLSTYCDDVVFSKLFNFLTRKNT